MWEIGTEALQFPEKEYVKGISLQCTQYADYPSDCGFVLKSGILATPARQVIA
jgi:hypothetical protein